MSKINGKIELISTVKRNNYIKSSVEKIKEDFQIEIKENGINTYEFPVFHDAYRAYMTDEQLDKTVEYAIDIIEEPVIVKIVVSKILIFYWLHIHLGCRTLLWAESSCQ